MKAWNTLNFKIDSENFLLFVNFNHHQIYYER